MPPLLTIPKKLAKRGELVILPKKEYEDLLKRAVPLGRLTVAEKNDLEKARKEMARGDYYTLEELEHELGTTRPRPSKKRTR